MTATDKSAAEREAFEATVGRGRDLYRDHSGSYASMHVQNDWEVWQAAAKELQRAACNFCLEEAAKARASLTTPSKEPAGAVAVPLVAIHLIEDAAQAHDQCRAVVHMALSLAEVYAARAVILSSSANAPIEIIGESSAATMEYLGDLLSSMDAVEEGDAWLDPIFEAAHARWPLAAPGAAIDAREREVSSRFTTKYPLLNDLLQETWWLGKGPNSMDTGLAWFASLERFLEWLASHPEAPAASAPAAETPTDEAIEDFLAARMTQEGRVPMLRTIREALTHFAAPAAEVAQPVGYEHFAAIREGHRNAAEDAWFQAIPNMEPRRAFQVGFDAGYNTRDAALASSPSSGPSGGNLPPLPSIIPEGTPLAHAFREYARQAVYASSPSSTPAESDTESVAVPLNFLQGFLTLAHNYSLRAEAPDFYDGRAGDAFSDAYRRCGRDLGKLRDMLPAAPQAIQAAGEGGK